MFQDGWDRQDRAEHEQFVREHPPGKDEHGEPAGYPVLLGWVAIAVVGYTVAGEVGAAVAGIGAVALVAYRAYQNGVKK